MSFSSLSPRCSTSPPATGTAIPLRTALSALVVKIDNLYKVDRASALTDDIAELDTTRDKFISGIALLAQAHMQHPTAANREAGEAILRSIEVYGNVNGLTQQSYNEQSASVASLLNDWDATLSAEYDHHRRRGLGHRAHYRQHGDEYGIHEPHKRNSRRAKPRHYPRAACGCYAGMIQLRDKFDGFYEVTDAAAPWGDMVPNINTLIKQYIALIDSRGNTGGDGGGGGAGGSQD